MFQITEALTKNQKLHAYMTTDLVNVIISELRTISTELKLGTLRDICHQLALKHPRTFNDTDQSNNKIFSNYSVLTTKMTNRNHYLNSLRGAGDKSTKPESKSTRKLCVLRNSCKNFDPAITLNNIEIENSRIWLKNNLENGNNINEIKMHINVTYAEQRRIINGKMEMELLRNKWNCLFTQFGISQHFENLTVASKDMFLYKFDFNTNAILKYGKKSKLIKHQLYFKSKNLLETHELAAFKFLPTIFSKETEKLIFGEIKV